MPQSGIGRRNYESHVQVDSQMLKMRNFAVISLLRYEPKFYRIEPSICSDIFSPNYYYNSIRSNMLQNLCFSVF